MESSGANLGRLGRVEKTRLINEGRSDRRKRTCWGQEGARGREGAPGGAQALVRVLLTEGLAR